MNHSPLLTQSHSDKPDAVDDALGDAFVVIRTAYIAKDRIAPIPRALIEQRGGGFFAFHDVLRARPAVPVFAHDTAPVL